MKIWAFNPGCVVTNFSGTGKLEREEEREGEEEEGSWGYGIECEGAGRCCDWDEG